MGFVRIEKFIRTGADGLTYDYGKLTKLPRRYISRERLCLRGTTDHRVNALDGQPFFRVTQPIDPGLIITLENDIIPRLLDDIPNQATAEALTAVPYLHRFTGEDWEQTGFTPHQVTLQNGDTVALPLAERGTRIRMSEPQPRQPPQLLLASPPRRPHRLTEYFCHAHFGGPPPATETRIESSNTSISPPAAPFHPPFPNFRSDSRQVRWQVPPEPPTNATVMNFRNALAAVAVNDLEPAVSWYQVLVGRPPDARPMSGVASWQYRAGGWLIVFVEAERAGQGTVIFAVVSLDSQVADLEEKGISFERVIRSPIGEVAIAYDPDGNRLVFAGPLTGVMDD